MPPASIDPTKQTDAAAAESADAAGRATGPAPTTSDNATARSATASGDEIFLGTVAIEPNRWAQVDKGWGPTILVSEYLDLIADAGFDGIEIWDKHLSRAEAPEADAVVGHRLPIRVFNSYISLDEPNPAERVEVAEWVRRTQSTGVKFNVGNDPSAESVYAERIIEWLEVLPDDVALLCECHHGISIAEDPVVAARIFDGAGPPERLQAIVHTHENHDHVAARFDAYGERITHAHVNYLDFASGGGPPPLAEQERLAADVDHLRAAGFDGSWTIEFVHGTLSPHNDHVEFLLAEAGDDLAVLRRVLA